jgi:hypothetical protein
MAFELLINFSLFYILWSAYDRHVKENENHVGYGYIDSRGYERDVNGDLIHRKVAFRYHYNSQEYSQRYREYDVHHKDGNKRNNSPGNLQILTREEHKKLHKSKIGSRVKPYGRSLFDAVHNYL